MVFSEINKKLEAKKHTTLHHAKRIGFSGVWLTAVLLIVQIIMLLDIFMRFGQHSPYIFEILSLVSSAVMVYIINDKSNPAYKIAWIIPVMLMPLFGGVLYLFVKLNFGALAPKRVLNRNLDRTKKYAKTSDEVRAGIEKEEASFGKLADYIDAFLSDDAIQSKSATYAECTDKPSPVGEGGAVYRDG